MQNSPVFHFINVRACVWIRDLHNPSGFFSFMLPFYVSTFQFPLFLFRLWITQLPYADTIGFPLSLGLLQLQKHPLMPVSLALSQTCIKLSSQLLAYAVVPANNSHHCVQVFDSIFRVAFIDLSSSDYYLCI